MADVDIYELPIDFAPDPAYVNFPPDYEYLAWRIARDPARGTSLWIINQVVVAPTVEIAEILPPPAEYANISIPQEQNLNQLGYSQGSYTQSNFSALATKIENLTEYAIDEQI